jgi:hypothetical protein
MSGFGKANIDTQYDGPQYFKMRTPDVRKGETETTMVLRLLPSMHSYRDSGQWKFYYGQHYGYAGVNSRDPSKPRARPFGCIQKKNKQKEILVACPKCTQMAQFEAKKEARESELAKEHGVGDSKEERNAKEFYEIKKNDQKFQTFASWLSKHNCDKKFWINAMDRDGKFGQLQLSYTTTEEKLMPLLRKLSSGEETGEKVDAFDPGSGIWLKFTRSGKAPRVIDTITVFEELVDLGGGKKAKVAQPAPMTQEQIEKALKTCKDLAKDVVKFIDAETIQRLVNCSGDPEEVDAIWPQEEFKKAAPKSEVKQNVSDDSFNDDLTNDETPGIDFKAKAEELRLAEVKAQAAKAEAEALAVQQALAAKVVVEEDDEEAALMKQLAEAKARKAAKVAAEKTQSAVGMGSTVDDPMKFLESFGK